MIIKPEERKKENQKNRGKETKRTEGFAEAENQRNLHTDEGEAGDTEGAQRLNQYTRRCSLEKKKIDHIS